MPTYPGYVEGWDVETTHPIEETEEGPLCTTCLDTVQPTINRAIDWGDSATGHQITDQDGTVHVITVRRVEP